MIVLEPLEARRLLSHYVVSTGGDDAGPGAPNAPWATLQHAAEVVQAGDSVTVLPGHYAGFLLRTSGTAQAPITFTAKSGVIIDSRNLATPDGINLEGASFVVIEGFSLTGLPRAGIRAVQDQGVKILSNQIDQSGYWGILTGFSQDVDIENNIVTGSIKQHGIYVGNSADNPVIRGNTVSGNHQCGIQINSDASQGGDGIITGAVVEANIVYDNGRAGGAAINLDGVGLSTVDDNLIYDNHATGIALYRQDGAAPPADDVIVNNTVVMPADARWALSLSDGANGIFVGNNILLTQSDRRGVLSVAADSRAGLLSDHNAVSNRFSDDGGDSNLSLANWRRQTGQDANSMLATPQGLFANFARRDFHLAQHSPAESGGSPAHLPQKDIESKQPADPKHPAIGAYQQTKPRAGALLGGEASASTWALGWRGGLVIAAAGAATAAVLAAWAVRRRALGRWLGPYIAQSLRRPRRRPSGETHLLLCIADHFEPQHGHVDHEHAMVRINRWEMQYPLLFGTLRDSDGKPPRHTFFYPLEQFDPAEMAALAQFCRAGLGEVEVHLHHDRDTAENLRRRLSSYCAMLAERFGMLATHRRDGRTMYGFVHGNWALDNSRPDGRWCGVDGELDVLRQTGCYADFTLPSAPNPTQVRKINSIYYALEDGRPRSHERGTDVGAAPAPSDGLMLIQGPLLLNWRRRKWGLLPRIENACLQANQPPDIHRLDLWLKAAIRIPSRPDWFFVKLHTHGAPEANQQVLLGPAMVEFHTALAKRSMFDPNFHYHYVTAREMYNLVRAAEDRWTGSVDDARDYELLFNGRAPRWTQPPAPVQSCCG
ncbi:MAG: right-handed parallel beta-helix repeat-containing protein [Tepidisphaeraceae bacterium]|jgi:parallel beta-helix repeat protein